ncbi:MAG: hypothetical protein LHV68_06085 [Elusimicrobia bacterium]|nr:hypothetical protein [Candidatus Liberimonas magnetica]
MEDRKIQNRTQYVVDLELQFWFTLILIIIVSVEGIFMGWGMHSLYVIATDWQRPDMASDFFMRLGFILLLLIGGNTFIGLYLSHKIAGPLYKLRRALKDIKSGEINPVQVRSGDMVKDFVKEFNETIFLLDKLISRDKKVSQMALGDLNGCLDELKDLRTNKETVEKVTQRLIRVKSFLTSIGSHFKHNTAERETP